MEDTRFDRLTRGVAGSTTRRSTLAGLLGGLALPLAGVSLTGADKRQGQAVNAEKKRKKKCKSGLLTCTIKKGKKKKRICVDAQNDPLNCGSCGKTCASGQICQGGTCLCPGEQTTCGDACFPATDECCPAELGGGACPPDTQCCPPRKDGTREHTCLEAGDLRFCCGVNSGGACVAADEACCPPDKTNGINGGCCLQGEACCNSSADCASGEICAGTGCCRPG